MSELNDREQRLVAIGAAIAGNCVPCIEYNVPEARNAGLTDTQIREAVKIADRVRQVPARLVLEAALARIEEPLRRPPVGSAAGCGCGDSDRDPGPAGDR